MTAYLNNAYLPLSEAKVSALDRGFLFGDGVYEVIPVYHNTMFRGIQHLARLQQSLDGIDIKNPHTEKEWQTICNRLIQDFDSPTCALYIQVTRGASQSRSHQHDNTTPPTVFATCIPMPPKANNGNGLRIVSLPDDRWRKCAIKSINLLPNILAKHHATDTKANDALFIENNHALEGSSNNLFIVKNNTLITPPTTANILPGITRAFVLEIASENQIPYEERMITLNECYAADELWLTSSTQDIMPVLTLDDKTIGKGTIGPMFQRMNTLFQSYKESETKHYDKGTRKPPHISISVSN